MASFGSKKLINKIPHPGELRNPISIGRLEADPDTETGFDYRFVSYRQCYAKIEIDEINTSGNDEDFLQELTHNFIIRKAPKVKIEEKKDRIIYKDEVFIIQNVLEVNQDRQRFWQVIQCTRSRALNNVNLTPELNKEVAKEETTNDSFFGGNDNW